MNFILFDDQRWEQLLPLTFTKPVSELRIGIDTIKQKWDHLLQFKTSQLSENYLQEKFPALFTEDNIYINGGILPTNDLIAQIKLLQAGEKLMSADEMIAVRSSENYFSKRSLNEHVLNFKAKEYSAAQNSYISISRSWHLFQFNDAVLRKDYERLTANRKSAQLSSTNILIGDNLFIEEGASVEACTINTKTGPVYIGKNSEVMEGCLLRGPLSIGEHATIKMGAKIYGATTIGPFCKAGGEISNSILTAYSNKGHDGFLGNSVLGEWCNIGADSNSSNLKNNYAEVKLWDYVTQKFIATGLQFCGLIMADHSKCSINTMFNTGTVIGVNSNIFGDGFPRNFIPSFSWGGAAGFVTYKLKDALVVAEEVMKRREIELTKADKNILTTIYEMSEKYRKGQLIFIHR